MGCECSMLNVCLLVSSADNLCKEFGSRSGSKLMDILIVFMKEILKKLILKNINRQHKSMQNYPVDDLKFAAINTSIFFPLL